MFNLARVQLASPPQLVTFQHSATFWPGILVYMYSSTCKCRPTNPSIALRVAGARVYMPMPPKPWTLPHTESILSTHVPRCWGSLTSAAAHARGKAAQLLLGIPVASGQGNEGLWRMGTRVVVVPTSQLAGCSTFRSRWLRLGSSHVGWRRQPLIQQSPRVVLARRAQAPQLPQQPRTVPRSQLPLSVLCHPSTPHFPSGPASFLPAQAGG